MVQTILQQKMKTLGLAVFAACLSLGAAAQSTTGGAATSGGTSTNSGAAAGATAGSLDKADRRFVEDAAIGGMAEVQLGNLAQQKASSDAVKQFGSRMAQDHGKANDELKQIAGNKGVQLPPGLDDKHQKEMERLSKLSGADFDREYMRHMVTDHKKDVSEFQKEARSGKDGDIKDFASKTLPTLQDHLKQAEAVRH